MVLVWSLDWLRKYHGLCQPITECSRAESKKMQITFDTLALVYYAMWLVRNTRTTFSTNQWEAKPKPIVLCSHAFSRRVFASDWIIHWPNFFGCDRPELSLGFWFYDTQSKTDRGWNFQTEKNSVLFLKTIITGRHVYVIKQLIIRVALRMCTARQVGIKYTH